MSLSLAEDELTATICGAVQHLVQIQKAGVLLNIALTLVDDGRSWDEVEKCLGVYLKTPGLPKEGVAKALLARENARKLSGVANERQGVQALQGQLPCKELETTDLACQRVPPEIWEQIAVHVSRYHLRTWLFVSRFYRTIASRQIFHTMDIAFGNHDDLNRTLDIFYLAKNDPVFASNVKSLRLHWKPNRNRNSSDFITYIFKTYLPALKALRNFEWIGYSETQGEIIQVLLETHKDLSGLGLMGRDFSATSVFAFDKLHKFKLALHGGFSDVVEIRRLLDRNECTLKHLVLCGSPNPDVSWDFAFRSATINNLTHLDLVNTCVSTFVLTRIASAYNLQSLSLLTKFEDPFSSSVLFASDRIIDGSHTLLPHLEALRFVLDDTADRTLYASVINFLRKREKLRKLDLGRCPWDMVQDILPDLRNLRVLGVYVDHLSEETMKCLVESIPRQMVAIDLLSDGDLGQYARYFTRFNTLSFLHLRMPGNEDYEDESLFSIAATIPSLDFLMWDFVPYAVARSTDDGGVLLAGLRKRWEYGSCVDFGSDDAAWLEQLDLPFKL